MKFVMQPRSLEVVNAATSVAQNTLGFLLLGATASFTYVTYSVVGIPLKILLGFDLGTGLLSFLPLAPETTHNPLAEGGSGYKVWETLDYYIHMSSENDRIENMGADYYLDWRFRTDSDDVFAIKISAIVDWGQWIGSQWYKVSETPVSLAISIANYWR